MNAILGLEVINSPAMWAVYALAVAVTIVLIWRRPNRRWARRAVIFVLAGVAIGVIAFFLVNAFDLFGVDIPLTAGIWTSAALAGSGLAIASLWGSRLWRKIVASVAIPVYIVAALLGVNAYYGLNTTLGAMIGVLPSHPITLPALIDDTAAPTQPLATTWTAPAGMPAVGVRGSQEIPGVVSGFEARDAGIYLPPAALVKDPPALPLVIMMMGFTGNPDPTSISNVLDQFAARNKGLAPIVIVADQLGGDGTQDPACADSKTFGNAETYVTTDVVTWATQHLNVIDDPRYRVIAGYSNGGGCASKYGATYPDLFQSILSVSGEVYPGSENVNGVIRNVYGGDQAAFKASWPVNIMARAPAGTYAGMTAIYTAGANDPVFVAAAKVVSTAAAKAGMAVTLFLVPDGDHGGVAVSGGLTKGFEVLYPILGLSASG